MSAAPVLLPERTCARGASQVLLDQMRQTALAVAQFLMRFLVRAQVGASATRLRVTDYPRKP